MKSNPSLLATVLCASLISAAAILPSTAEAQNVVAPNSLEGVEGNTSNVFPFSHTNAAGMRYQQVYGAGEFSSFTEPFYIDAVTFRPDAVFSSTPYSFTLNDIEIRFSTTSRAVDALSSTFASNIGADEMTVFNGALTLSSGVTGPSGGPKDFDITIPFQTPFLFDPTHGNLLMDVFNRSKASALRSFDAENTLGDGISRVHTGSGGSVDSLTGSVNTFGLVTRFTVTPVPEPSVYSLGLLGAGTLGILIWRRRSYV